ncbi:MAG TPA: hypothetical protein VIO11_01775 [Candidatus Methanoperedens sp.]
MLSVWLVLILSVIFSANSAGAVPAEEWNRTYSNVGKIFDVQQTQDGGYVLAAPKHMQDAAVDGYYLIRTDASGNEQWSRRFGSETSIYSIEKTIDDGYILAGSKSFTGDYGVKDVAFVTK